MSSPCTTTPRAAAFVLLLALAASAPAHAAGAGAAAATSAASQGGGPAARSRAKFDFGWRFHLGPVTPGGQNQSCTAAAFPVNLSGIQCLGLSQGPDGSSASHESCRAAACEL